MSVAAVLGRVVRRGGRAAAGGGTPAGADPEAGFSLVELMVSVLVLSIAMSMTVVIVSVVNRQASTQLNQGRAVETAQIALSGLEQYVDGATSPLAAYQAANNSSGGYPSSGDCWARTYPGPSPQSPLIANQNATGTTTTTYDGVANQKVVDPSTLSIIYAHDYDLELCAYPDNSTTPAVYEIYLNTSTCTNSTYGFCTVEVLKYTTSGTVGGTNCSLATNWYHQPTSKCATVVDQVSGVWCNAECQLATTQTTGQTTYNSCWSYLPDSQALPADCTAITTSNESTYTPPLFQYYGPTSDSGQSINTAASPFDLYCTGGACNPPTSTDDTANLVDADIQSVELDLTLLSGTGTTLTGHKESPGTTVTAYLSLGNLND